MAVPQPVPHTHTVRGDALVPNKKPLPEGNIVKTYQIGESLVHICDDFVAKTPEAVERVVRNMHLVGWKIVLEAREKGIEV